MMNGFQQLLMYNHFWIKGIPSAQAGPPHTRGMQLKNAHSITALLLVADLQNVAEY